MPTRNTSTERAPVAINELSHRRKIGILAICCTSLFIVGIDITGVNIALPSIGSQLHTGITGLQWTVDAYTVVLASLLMLSGSVADRFGRKRTFITGLTVFSIGSLLCSLAPTVGLLTAFRALQAIGGSMLNPVAMSIITNTFTKPHERARAVGVWGAVFGISMALGPLLGGTVVSTIGWRAIFYINIPVGLAAIMLTWRFVSESKAPRPRRFDPVGQALVIVGLATLTYAIIEASTQGWASPTIAAAFAASAAALLALVLYERRRHEPLIDLRFFRSIPFTTSVLTSIAAFGAFGGFLFLNTLYLQEARHLTPIHAGLATLPMAVMVMVSSPISGRIVGRHGPRLPLVISGVGLATGSAILIGLDPTTSLAPIFAAYVVFGIGFGFVNAPITNAAVSGMPRAQAGVASAIATTSRQFGQTLGVAIVGAIITTQPHQSAPGGPSAASQPAWWMLTGCGALVLTLGLLATTSRARASAARTATQLNPEALAPKSPNPKGLTPRSHASNRGTPPTSPALHALVTHEATQKPEIVGKERNEHEPPPVTLHTQEHGDEQDPRHEKDTHNDTCLYCLRAHRPTCCSSAVKSRTILRHMPPLRREAATLSPAHYDQPKTAFVFGRASRRRHRASCLARRAGLSRPFQRL